MAARINDVANKDTRCDNFRIWTLFFVQVPRSADTEKISCVSRTVENENDQIKDLQAKKKGEKKFRKLFSL